MSVLRKRLRFLVFLVVFGVLGCDERAASEPARAEGPLRIVVSIPPLAGILEHLAPEGTQITTLVAPGDSAHSYEITPRQVEAIGRADLIVGVGLGMEAPARQVLGKPRLSQRSVYLSELLLMTEEEHDHDAHTHEGHSHGPVDPHLWLDPSLVIQVAPSLSDAIEAACERASISTDGQSERLAAFVAEARALDSELRAILQPFEGKSIITDHPAFGRFAEHYGLRIYMTLRPHEHLEATPEAVSGAVRMLREGHASAIFGETGAGASSRDLLKRMASTSDDTNWGFGVLDPLGDGDWLALMRQNAQAIADAMPQ